MIQVETRELREAERRAVKAFAWGGVLRGTGTQVIIGNTFGSRVEIDLEKTDTLGNHPIISKSWIDNSNQANSVAKDRKGLLTTLFKRK